MSTALLQELHQEVRRLYIAGSDLAAGDFRLKRLLPQFQQLGERAPVFKKLGEGITAILEPSEGTGTALGLQNLALLLGSVLYTQGTTTVDGEVQDIEGQGVMLSSQFGYRRLAEVQRALTTTGSGRYEIVTAAFAAGLFQDLRLLPFALKALDDPYSELADFAMNTILPAYGAPIVPYLVQDFNPGGGKSEVRKLNVIRKVGGGQVLDLLFQTAEEAADEVRAAAIEALAGHEDYTEALIAYTKDKKKPIREAAYHALAEGGTAEGRETLLEAFTGKDKLLVAAAIQKHPSPQMTERLAPLFTAELEQLPAAPAEKKEADKAEKRLEPYLTAFSYAQHPLLMDIFGHIVGRAETFAALGLQHVLILTAVYLERSGSPKGLELLEELDKQYPVYLSYTFRLGYAILPPDELYMRHVGSTVNRLKSVVSKKAKAREEKIVDSIDSILKQKRQEYLQQWSLANGGAHYEFEVTPVEHLAAGWDPRWLDWLIDRDEIGLVSEFARPGHPRVEKYLVKTMKDRKQIKNSTGYIIIRAVFAGLERAKADKQLRDALLLEVLEDKKTNLGYNINAVLYNQMLQFPPEYADRLEAVIPQYSSFYIVRQIKEVVHILRESVKPILKEMN
ncbi:HEAT repeat domain-containing protein [Paenibacillus donghaensis]|uniref:HEAT repeat domain-containing protein n=1 Tax=Paenibacillus donghaensis TaxID=414771 RepID=A0A2Z2KDL5_9BACL|nr:HEAT repeat domain-containing protein [Paenibacillus donghaensis]ASA21123.1 hypothetical protein B9T62_10190 [Paenibacillus donghaensis]